MNAIRPAHAGLPCLAFIAALSAPVLAQVPARTPTVEQLQAELDRRDAIIADLLQRVQALERRAGVGAPPAPPARVAPPPARTAARTPADEAAEEALLERALERSLVLSGGALVPRGQKEIEPSAFYDHFQRSGLAAFGDVAVTRSVRRENFGAGLAFRMGLPWSSQLDLAVPFAYQRIESVVDGISRTSSSSGAGDIQVALTHQFLTERDSGFGLLAGVGWIHATRHGGLRPLVLGLPDFIAPAAVGSGHDSFLVRATATKRMDPLVFVGSLSHAWSRDETVEGVDVRAGNAASANLRAILAVSPDVSLRAGLAFTRTGKSRIRGIDIEGTRATASILELGTSVILGRNRLLDVALGVGLTSESPDFSLGVSMPIRF
jgi:hypothetical protein